MNNRKNTILIKRRYLKIITTLIIMMMGQNTFSQINKSLPISIPSPNASSLGRYDELPVSFFTGVPDISIPIYTIQGKDIILPISLSYHSSGIMPEIHPGWVGNGWTLFAGGAITRVQNGGLDELSIVSNNYDEPRYGYYFNHGDLNVSDWSSSASLSSYPGTAYPYPGNTALNIDPDLEPDQFNFNFLGYSGKFFLDQTGNWRVQCDKPLKVIFDSTDFVSPFITATEAGLMNQPASVPFDANNVSKTFGRFTIINESGNKYVFGSTDQYNTAIEFSDVMIPQGSTAANFGTSILATTWYLTQIISANGSETINLNYKRGPLTSYIGYNHSDGQVTARETGGGETLQTIQPWSICGYSGRIIFPVYLTSISMPNKGLSVNFTTVKSNELSYNTLGGGDYINDVFMSYFNPTTCGTYPIFPPNGSSTYFPFYAQFITSQNIMPYYASNPVPASNFDRFIWLRLAGMSISNTFNGGLKIVQFYYNSDSTKRLELDSLKLDDKADNPVETYKFGYNTTPLPKYLATITDHWGYNNNVSLLSAGTNYSQSRAPDPTGVQTQAGILTSIMYPTGGKTSFTYEPNTYSSVIYRNNSTTPVAESGIAGGLRIKQIINSDCEGHSLIKNFYYVNGYTPGANISTLPSSGVLDSKPLYSFSNRADALNGDYVTYTTVNSSPVVPLTMTGSGSFIGYTNVIEQRSDGAYTMYQYTNSDNGFADLPYINSFAPFSTDFFPCTSLGYERGKLTRKTDYDSNGKIVEDNITQYPTSIPASTPSARGVFRYLFSQQISGADPIYGGPYFVGVISRSAYLLYYFPFVPISQTTILYDNDATKSSISQLKSYQYNSYGFVSSVSTMTSATIAEVNKYKYPTDYTTAPYTSMVAANILSPVIENVTSMGGIQQTLFHTNYFSPYTGMYVPSDVQIQIQNNPIETRYQFNKYDTYGNIEEQQQTNGKKEVYLWGYNGEYPVAHIVGSDYATVNSIVTQAQINSAISNGDASLRTNLNTLRTAGATKGASITTYTYSPCIGMTSSTDPMGNITSYLYDLYNRLIKVFDKDNNTIKAYNYSYSSASAGCSIPTLYQNTIDSAVFTKNDCNSGQTPTSVTYVVPAGKYTSIVSLADANQKAQNEIDSLGQSYTNQNAKCLETLMLTFNVTSNVNIIPPNEDVTSFMITINGVNVTGPRTVPGEGGGTNSLSTHVLQNPNSTLLFNFLPFQGSPAPQSVTISGPFGTKSTAVYNNAATFAGLNFSYPMTITVTFN